MDKNCIQVNNLSMTIHDSCILDAISTSFQKGKITSIIGSNGCGKSTLLSMLSKQNKPTSGSICIENIDINNYSLKQLARKIAVVNQVNRVEGDITVEQFVRYARIPYQGLFSQFSNEDHEKVLFALEVCDLLDIKDQAMDTLSGGQKQRVFIALAVAKDCSIILFDEPTTYMDIKYQIKLLEFIKKLNEMYGITIIMVLHDINQALYYSHHIVGMKQGTIVFDDSSDVLSEKDLYTIYDIDLNIVLLNDKKYVIQKEMV